MNEVAEVIRRTRRTLAERTWVPHFPDEEAGEICVATAVPWMPGSGGAWDRFQDVLGVQLLEEWNDRQTDVGAVLGMTLQALIAELCKPTLAPRTTEA